MLATFFMSIIMVVLNITISQLSKQYAFLVPYVMPAEIAMWIVIAIFIIFTLVTLIRRR